MICCRCCAGGASGLSLIRSGAGGEFDEENAKELQGVATALFEAQGLEWRCGLDPRGQVDFMNPQN